MTDSKTRFQVVSRHHGSHYDYYFVEKVARTTPGALWEGTRAHYVPSVLSALRKLPAVRDAWEEDGPSFNDNHLAIVLRSGYIWPISHSTHSEIAKVIATEFATAFELREDEIAIPPFGEHVET